MNAEHNQEPRVINVDKKAVHAWWTWVLQSLDTHSPNEAMSHWVSTRLLPVAYWQQQLAKTKTPTLHPVYRSAYAQAHLAFAHDPVPSSVPSQQSFHFNLNSGMGMVISFIIQGKLIC